MSIWFIYFNAAHEINGNISFLGITYAIEFTKNKKEYQTIIHTVFYDVIKKTASLQLLLWGKHASLRKQTIDKHASYLIRMFHSACDSQSCTKSMKASIDASSWSGFASNTVDVKNGLALNNGCASPSTMQKDNMASFCLPMIGYHFIRVIGLVQKNGTIWLVLRDVELVHIKGCVHLTQYHLCSPMTHYANHTFDAMSGQCPFTFLDLLKKNYFHWSYQSYLQ